MAHSNDVESAIAVPETTPLLHDGPDNMVSTPTHELNISDEFSLPRARTTIHKKVSHRGLKGFFTKKRLQSAGFLAPDDEDDWDDDEVEAIVRATAFQTHAASGKNPSLRERLAFYLDASTTGRW
jgi:hypothetical protein